MSEPHWFGPSADTSGGGGHPVLFGPPPVAEYFGRFPDGGGYPNRFLPWAYGVIGREQKRDVDPARVLHLCSGSVLTGVRVDIRPEMQPDIVSDCRNVPLPDESFDVILADPPYSTEYATNLYGVGEHYPKPGQIAREACRLLKPGGYFGLLHFQVPMLRKPMRIVRIYGVTTGAGYSIRAWTLCQKEADHA